jgi:glutathione peroxidase-family protein
MQREGAAFLFTNVAMTFLMCMVTPQYQQLSTATLHPPWHRQTLRIQGKELVR